MALPKSVHLLAKVGEKVPVLKQIPLVKLLMVGEVVLLARDHYERLTQDERRRLMVLLREAKGRPKTLTDEERNELQSLVAKAAPRLFAAEVVDRMSPVPIPGMVKQQIAGKPSN